MRNFIEFGIAKHVRVALAKLRGSTVHRWHRLLRAIGVEREGTPRTSAYGVKLAANFGDRTFRYCYYGTYGRHIADFIAGRTAPFVFVDIGANQGVFSMVAAANPACREVIALEPVVRTYGFLEKNFDLNGVNGKARPFNAALSDRDGEARIRTRIAHSGAATLNGHELADSDGDEAIRLMSVDELDQALANSAGEAPELVVKVDVEGHEEVVIGELARSVHFGRVAAIFYEVDERWIDAENLRNRLSQHGFAGFRKFGIGKHYDVLAERAPP